MELHNFEEQFLLSLVPHVYESATIPPRNPPSPPISNAENWTHLVREDIRKISKTKVGNLLLRSLKYYGKVITIRPMRSDSCNAVSVEGDVLHNQTNLQIVTGAEIWFTPNTYHAGSRCAERYAQMGGYRIESHEVLLHEMVHTLRRLSDKQNPVSFGKGLSFYHTNEEFAAVIVQGTYASERKTPIRSSHFRHFEIDRELAGSLKFFQSSTDTFEMVRQFCQENPGFTRALAEISLPFNPVRAFYKCRAQAERMSKSAVAKRRDQLMPVVKTVLDFIMKEIKTK